MGTIELHSKGEAKKRFKLEFTVYCEDSDKAASLCSAVLNLVPAQQIVRATVWHQEGDGFEEIEISGARERAVKVRIVPEEN
jgi:hypothetical protein